MTKEEYWIKHGAEYDRKIRNRLGLNPLAGLRQLELIGRLHVRNKRRLENEKGKRL